MCEGQFYPKQPLQFVGVGQFFTVPVLAYQTTTRSGTNLTNYSFPSIAIGTASAGRRVFVTVHYGAGSGGFTLSSATIGGVAATIHVDHGVGTSNFRAAAIISAIVPTGTTATVAINFSGSVGRCGIGVWACTGLRGSAPTATTTSSVQPTTLSLTRPRNGIVLAAWSAIVSSTGNISWTNATERYDANNETTTQEGGADVSGVANTQALSVTGSVTNISGGASAAVALAWV